MSKIGALFIPLLLFLTNVNPNVCRYLDESLVATVQNTSTSRLVPLIRRQDDEEGDDDGESNDGDQGDAVEGLGGEIPADLFENSPLLAGSIGEPGLRDAIPDNSGNSASDGNDVGGGGIDEAGDVGQESPDPNDRTRPRGPFGRALQEVRKFRERTNGLVSDVRKRFVDWLDGYSEAENQAAEDGEEKGDAGTQSEEEKRRTTT